MEATPRRTGCGIGCLLSHIANAELLPYVTDVVEGAGFNMPFEEAPHRTVAAALPERIEIQILSDGVPLPGSLADVTLSMTVKNPHTMVLGPADGAGRIVASKSEILEKAWENCSNFVMDYADLSQHFGGSVEVKPVTPARIAEMLKAYEVFKEHLRYPPAWFIALQKMEKWFAHHSPTSLETRVTVTPAEVRVTVPEVQL